MAMNQHIRPPAHMSFEEFATFYASRPHGEKWELLEGDAVLSASPNAPHQQVLLNLGYYLESIRRSTRPAWRVLPDLSLHVAEVPASAPEPDALIVPEGLEPGAFHDHPLVVFEILSPSTRRRDLGIKCDIYRRMLTIGDYVVISLGKCDVMLFARSADWEPERFVGIEAVVPLASVRLDLPLAAIYHDMAV
jgi:Uma2 family endonuclease